MRPTRSFIVSIAALVAVASAAMLVVACGGDSGEDGEEFAAAADRICVETAERDVAERPGRSTSQVEYLEQLRASREQTLRQLEGLSPPGDSTAAFEDYLASRREAVERLGDGIKAVEDENAGAYERFRRAARKRVEAGDELAGEAGLVACAGTVSPAERRAIEETVAMSIEPARAREFCAERSTEAMIAGSFSGIADCARQQSQRAETESATIVRLSGIDGVSANALAALDYANGEKGRFEVSLHFEDGVWKFDSVSELSG